MIFIHIPKTAGTFIRNYFMNTIKKSKFKVRHYVKHDDFEFTFIRNPWDWQVSFYFHFRQSWQNPNIEKFINEFPTFNTYMEAVVSDDTDKFINDYGGKAITLFNSYTSCGIYDDVYVGKVETIYDDIEQIFIRNGYTLTDFQSPQEFYNQHYITDMEHINSVIKQEEVTMEEALSKTFRRGHKLRSNIGFTIHKHYSHYYNKTTKQQIFDLNKTLIEKYNYEFEELN